MESPSLFDTDLRPRAELGQPGGGRPPGPPPGRRGTAGQARAAPGGAASAPDGTTTGAPPGPMVLAVDGNSLAHRAFHGYGTAGMGAPTGPDRSALYGFLALLAAIVERVSADALVIGFDCSRASHRRDRFPAYKAQRPAKDPAFHALLDLLRPVLADLELCVDVHRGWEADDVLGSVAAAAEAGGWRCVVATSDQDAYALVSERTTVLRLRAGLHRAEEVTPGRLRRAVGVQPGQYTEFAALRGDPSDNLPGVRGIGPARAAALLRAYARVADAAADPIGCRSVLGRRAGQALLDDLADPETSVFARNAALMRLRRDLPVDLDRARRRISAEQVPARLAGWGLQALTGRAMLAFAVRPDVPPPPEAPPLR